MTCPVIFAVLSAVISLFAAFEGGGAEKTSSLSSLDASLDGFGAGTGSRACGVRWIVKLGKCYLPIEAACHTSCNG